MIYQTLLLPLPKTLAYLSTVFSACPFDLDLDTAYVEVNARSSDLPEPQIKAGSVYTAHPGTMGMWFDPELGDSHLMLPLQSQSIYRRGFTLSREEPSVYGGFYEPVLILRERMPPRYRRLRRFTNAITDALLKWNEPMEFGLELVRVLDRQTGPLAGYYKREALDVLLKDPKPEHWLSL